MPQQKYLVFIKTGSNPKKSKGLSLYKHYEEILVMLRQGVKWLPDKQVDVLFITLNKSDKYYSPTTMYNDYSINERQFHWQSQSTTSDTSGTGQRYIHHQKNGSKIALFVREFKQDRIGAAPYTYLGTATYATHTGSKPMNITWKLDQAIPAKYLRKTNQLLTG
ncbi:MAG: DUF3427 domain-containing protein [Lachnospiraceae bacterium]